MINMNISSNELDVLDKESWVKTDYGLYYKKGQIKFIKLSSRDSLKDIIKLIEIVSEKEAIGIICSNLKESDLLILREKRISYLIYDREIKIFGKEERHTIKTSLGSVFLHDIAPTLLVSPTGLEVVDTILKLPMDQLKSDTPTKLCQDFELSRPKLSNIMKAFKVKNLVDLKNELLSLEVSWWIEAFNTPITKRKMTPFQTKRTRRYIFKNNTPDSEFLSLIQKLKDEEVDAEVGGLSYLKILGAIRTQDYDVVVRADQMIDVVEKMNLRPARKDELERNVLITPIDDNLNNERFHAKIKNYHNRFIGADSLNPLRYLWGLNYEESRIQEERKHSLEMYLNEAKKNNY